MYIFNKVFMKQWRESYITFLTAGLHKNLLSMTDFHQFLSNHCYCNLSTWTLSSPSKTWFLASVSFPLPRYSCHNPCFLFPRPELSGRLYPFFLIFLFLYSPTAVYLPKGLPPKNNFPQDNLIFIFCHWKF